MIQHTKNKVQKWRVFQSTAVALPGCLFVDLLVAITVLALGRVVHAHRVALPFVYWHCSPIGNCRLADRHKAVIGVTQDSPCAPDAVATKQTSITILQHNKECRSKPLG